MSKEIKRLNDEKNRKKINVYRLMRVTRARIFFPILSSSTPPLRSPLPSLIHAHDPCLSYRFYTKSSMWRYQSTASRGWRATSRGFSAASRVLGAASRRNGLLLASQLQVPCSIDCSHIFFAILINPFDLSRTQFPTDIVLRLINNTLFVEEGEEI